MAYTFTQDVPINADLYSRIVEGLGDEPPAGLIVHIALAVQIHPVGPNVVRRQDDPFGTDALKIGEQLRVTLFDLLRIQPGVVDEL